MRNFSLKFLVIICVVLAFSSFVWAEKPIRILVIYPLSGPMKDIGEEWLLGIRFATYEVNAKGGLMGRKVEVIAEDSQMKPDVAVSKAQRYLLEGNADIIISTSSNVVKPLQDLTKQYNVLFGMYSQGDDQTGKDFTYNSIRPLYNSSMMARALVAYIAKYKPFKKFFLLNQDYAYGRDFAAALKKETARLIPDAQIIGEEYHPLMSKDLSPFLTKIKASGAEAIYSANWGLDMSVLIKQRLELGVKAVLIAPALADDKVLRENPEAAFGNIACDSYFITLNTKEKVDFVNRWKKWYKGTEYPEPAKLIAREYMGMTYLFEGIRKAGSFEVNKLMPVMEGMRTKSVTGEIYMRACDHQLMVPILGVTVTSKTHPYISVPTILPATAVEVPEAEIDNPRCRKK